MASMDALIALHPRLAPTANTYGAAIVSPSRIVLPACVS